MSGLTVPVRLNADGKLDAFEDRLVKEIRDLKMAMLQSDVTENMVLSDIKVRDVENLKLVIKSARMYYFDDPNQALHEIGQFLKRALTKLGINALDYFDERPGQERANNRFVERRLTHETLKKKVHWEMRLAENYPPEDRWRSGCYLYHKNEIAYWISNILGDKDGRSGNGHIILPGKWRFGIVTNAPAP